MGEHTLVAVIGPLQETSGFVRTIRDMTKQRVIELHIKELEISVAILLEAEAKGRNAPVHAK